MTAQLAAPWRPVLQGGRATIVGSATANYSDHFSFADQFTDAGRGECGFPWSSAITTSIFLPLIPPALIDLVGRQ